MKHSVEVIEEWIRLVNEEPSKELTEWELGFMASVTDQFDRRGHLSERQEEILERIYAEKTS